MKHFSVRLRPGTVLAGDRRGTVAMEYAVIIGTLAAAIIASFVGLGGNLATVLTNLPI